LNTELHGSCAELLKILADETRLAVVRQLLQGAKHVTQINETLQIEQSLLSHHLKVLRDAGMVIARRDGKAMLYSLSPKLQGTAAGRRIQHGINLGCCSISFQR
jgi:ArsR family transcriptional regulator, nickel/cobalt-responsive transcriptional repressor